LVVLGATTLSYFYTNHPRSETSRSTLSINTTTAMLLKADGDPLPPSYDTVQRAPDSGPSTTSPSPPAVAPVMPIAPVQRQPTQPTPRSSPPLVQTERYKYPPQPQMSVGGQTGGNRNIADKPYDWRGEREWTHGLCDCFGTCGTWCTAFWCPCITYGLNRSRRLALERNGFPHPEGGYSCGGDCLLFALVHTVTGCGWVLEVGERGNTRQRYKITGNQCKDTVATFCCLPCVLTQESLEIEGEERSFGDVQGQGSQLHIQQNQQPQPQLQPQPQPQQGAPKRG